MSLSDITDKLYKKDAPENIPMHEESEYDPSVVKNSDGQTRITAEDIWTQKKGLDESGKRTIKKGAIILASVLALVLGLAVFYQIRKMSFSEEDTVVAITGPEQVRSGKLATYEITYKNNNRADMNESVLNLSFSEFFHPDDNPNYISDSPTSGHYDLGTIKSGGEGKIVFNGKAYSPKGALMYFKADLIFQPENFSGRFSAKNQLGINIISAPLELEIQAPQNVASGDEVNYLVSFRNDGVEALEGLKIKLDYPEKFYFSSSEPKTFEQNNIWYLGNLAPGQSGKIVISGRLEGERDEIKNARAYIGNDNAGTFTAYSEEDVDTKIVASSLKIRQTVNGSVDFIANSGDTLQFDLFYRNEGETGLRDVIVREKIESPVLDYVSLKVENGSFNFDEKTITWKAPDVKNFKNLESGEEGKISFSIKVKDKIDISSENDKNFVISGVAKIDSPDVPTPVSMNKIVSGNKMDIKLNSKVILDVKGFHIDPNISNSGPIPPKVGEETTYVLHWIITNVNNDISSAKVEAYLSTNAKMTGTVFPEDAEIEYNERANSIVWNIGNLKAGTGILSSPKEVSFQIKIKPSPDQVGREMELLGESKLTAKDNFTNENISRVASKKTTNLIEDKTIVDGGRVVE